MVFRAVEAGMIWGICYLVPHFGNQFSASKHFFTISAPKYFSDFLPEFTMSPFFP